MAAQKKNKYRKKKNEKLELKRNNNIRKEKKTLGKTRAKKSE